MKTEQEIRQMVNTCNVYRSCALCPYRPKDISRFIGDRWKGGCPNYDRQLVYAMGKGYGDISEYKAEIERLKEKNNELNKENWSLEEELKKKELEITYARNNGYEKGYDECEEYTKGKIKQAKIDVLNEVKTNISKSDDFMDICSYHIDKLIKEIENDNRRN